MVQEPRAGPIEPLQPLALGAWLRATEAGGLLEGAIREARVPSRFLLAGVVVPSVLVLLLLMRVGPGTGLAAATLPWRHRSGARSDPPSPAARLLAWTATTAAGALVAAALGYPADQALPFAVPAAAVALAVAGTRVLAAAGVGGLARLVATVKNRVPGCSAVNAGSPGDRARLLAAGAIVTGSSTGQPPRPPGCGTSG